MYPEIVTIAECETRVSRWREFAAMALNGQEELRAQIWKLETMLEHYADRVVAAEETVRRYEAERASDNDAMGQMASLILASGKQAEAIGKVMRYARDYIWLRTDTAYDGLRRAVAEYDELRKAEHNGH